MDLQNRSEELSDTSTRHCMSLQAVLCAVHMGNFHWPATLKKGADLVTPAALPCSDHLPSIKNWAREKKLRNYTLSIHYIYYQYIDIHIICCPLKDKFGRCRRRTHVLLYSPLSFCVFHKLIAHWVTHHHRL